MTKAQPPSDAAAMRETLQKPELSSDELTRAFRSRSQVVRRLLARHPACTPELLVQLTRDFPAEVASNPALEVYALAEPAFLSIIPRKAVARLLEEPELPETFLWWAVVHAETLEQENPGIRDLLCLHPKASRELLDTAGPSAVASLHVNSPVAWTLPWTAMFVAQRKTAHLTLPRLFHEGELQLVAAVARHAMFRGDCPSLAAIICAAGTHACGMVLANHPYLSDEVAAQLRRHSRGSVAPAQAHLARASAHWSEAETAYLASCGPVSHLSTFLMHASERLPAPMLVAAARRGNWRLRLAAAINPTIMPRARHGLATADACWVVRAAAMEGRPDTATRAPMRESEIREECLPRDAKARLNAARAYMRTRTADLHPEAIRQIWEDREIRHFALGGVIDDPTTPVLCARSPLASIPPNWRRSQIVKMVATLNRSE